MRPIADNGDPILQIGVSITDPKVEDAEEEEEPILLDWKARHPDMMENVEKFKDGPWYTHT